MEKCRRHNRKELQLPELTISNHSPNGWFALTVFVVLFLASWVAALVIGLGFTQLLQLVNAGPNVRTFVGDTLIRGGNLLIQLALINYVCRLVLQRSLLDLGFPLYPGWLVHLLYGILLGAGIMTLVFAGEIAAGWLTVGGWAWQSYPPDKWLRALWVALLSSTLAAVAEEAMMRGYLLTALARAWGKGIGLGVTALCFSLPHLLVSGAEETHWLVFIIFLALPGILFGWAYLRAGSLWLPVGLHFAWNFVSADLFNLSGKSGGSALFGAITRLNGPRWIVGTEYGIEVGVVGIIALGLAAVGIWLWPRLARGRTGWQPVSQLRADSHPMKQ